MQINQLIGDRYRIIEPLGEGGMANVYRAHDIILDRDVSLKLMRLDMRDNESVRRRFENEIAATSALIHPNIIQVYDYGEDGGSQYLVSEYVSGMDLKRYIAERQPIPVTRVIDIMSEILAGVGEAHKAGIVHRDLKPQNILINQNGEAKITDFGIARAQTSFGMTQTNTAIGSVHYMAPEQVKGEVATVRSDIYSLGVMLFEMLTGHVPFDGETAVAVAVKHTQEPMPSIRDIDPRMPQALENVILKATAKNPMSRYASAHEMAADLATALSPNRVNEARWEDPNEAVDDTVTKVIPLAPIHEMANTEAASEATTSPAVTAEPTAVTPDNPKSKWRWIWVALGVVAALVIGLGVYGATRPALVRVPDVSGMTQANASQALERLKLEVGDVTTTSSSAIDRGKVVRTTPARGKSIKAGAEVDLIVSKGPAKVRFGDYVNEKYTTVADKLKAKGFTVEQTETANSSIPAGYIISQNLDAEDRVIPGETTVRFKVSTGPKRYAVPDFSGKDRSEVASWAAENGISVTYNSVYSDSIAVDEVVSQSITPGSKITTNDMLMVTLSKGENPEAKAASEAARESSVSASIAESQSIADSEAASLSAKESSKAASEAAKEAAKDASNTPASSVDGDDSVPSSSTSTSASSSSSKSSSTSSKSSSN
ncbi:Stk1 family PASTA domain-containing Ser/Thr kinase [Weissella cibaria]|uniref:non-specific serine/threonine protein kinase n=1 Tax=Weissella cibaria TaxID=137591 RepID=A0A2S1KSU8_9LACO|nr:Stk1 family PASTA domain-containing Ser/Thr kinase [Weissella cibaria]AWF96085.1 Serine/threonine-protein kinase StkP [Weissella cibaria]